MTTKAELLAALATMYAQWEDILAGVSPQAAIEPPPGSSWSMRDLVAHLAAWQQVSLARLEAAHAQGEPVLPVWLQGGDPESESDIDAFNARIRASRQGHDWAATRQTWQAGFQRLLRLAESLPEELLLDARRFGWLKGASLAEVLEGTLDHHEEHLTDVSDPAV